MKQSVFRTALFALPLIGATVVAVSIVNAQEGRPGRDGPKVEMNTGKSLSNRGDRGDVRSERGSDRIVRRDRDGRNGDRYDGRRRWSGGDGGRRHWRSGRRYSWGPGVVFYLNDGYYYGECNWLKRRYRQTGHRVWLRRYAMCRNAV
jgi:hypothetical protein